MKISFEGIGQWSATFACRGEVAEGQMVKVCGGGEVSACAAGDKFCGITEVVARLKSIGAMDAHTLTYINHVAHNGNPLQHVLEARVEALGYGVAYDGLTVEV